MAEWEKIPIHNEVLTNVDEAILGGNNARIENGYIHEVKGFSRFPQLVRRVTLQGSAPTYLKRHKGDLIAVSGGRAYKVTQDHIATDVTGAAVSGQGRVIFAATDNRELLMAAGGQIIKLDGPLTEILSEDAPDSTHVAFVNGYVVAIEPGSGRFRFTPAGQYTVWDPLDTLSAEGKPDDLVALIITEYGEMILAGEESIEQFDAAPSGTKPFFKRWGLGDGLYAPYTLVTIGGKLWGINNRKEWQSYVGQVNSAESKDIQQTLGKIDNWEMAWAQALSTTSQRFIVLQMPMATNEYGTPGVTLLYDYRNKRWYTLYGWDSALNLPARWPGWSIEEAYNKIYVGGEGCIYELTDADEVGEQIQQSLIRTGHIDIPGRRQYRIDAVELRLKRGYRSSNAADPIISMRVNKDNEGFGRYMRETLGQAGKNSHSVRFGSLGTARSFQFEFSITDQSITEIIEANMLVTPLRS